MIGNQFESSLLSPSWHALDSTEVVEVLAADAEYELTSRGPPSAFSEPDRQASRIC